MKNSAQTNSEQQTDYDLLILAIEDLQTRTAPFFDAYDPESKQAWSPDWTLPTTSFLPPALAHLCRKLTLSEQDKDILLLCVAVELSPKSMYGCGNFHGSPQIAHVSPRLVIELFKESGVQALSPLSALCDWELVRLGEDPLACCPIQIDRAILQYLMGQGYQDGLFASSLHLIRPETIEPLPPSYKAIAHQAQTYWESLPHLAPIQLCGQDLDTQQMVAALICEEEELSQLSAQTLPTNVDELHRYCQHWKRQARLQNVALLINCHELKDSDNARLSAIAQFLAASTTRIILLASDRIKLPKTPFTIDIPGLTVAEQKAIWHKQIAAYQQESGSSKSAIQSNESVVSELVAQFNLSASAISSVAQKARSQTADGSSLTTCLWNSCRTQSRSQLEGFAKRVDSHITWDDLVFSEAITDSLKQIVAQVRQRATVYDKWEMASSSRRGLGITAMFHGVSGTGKTTAAELLAHDLGLDLYRIDLSAIVSKYIGETEKNLAKIFTAAEAAGAILQFDEADAIIGKRSSVKDARDRYANMEVSYLLQRMEVYPGLAILTTNLPDALDAAFLRRIRFSIRFDHPSHELRTKIWQQVYRNKAVPLGVLDARRLGAVDMTGAMIQNVALGAAFLAADDGDRARVEQDHILRATRAEYRKQGRKMAQRDIEILTESHSVPGTILLESKVTRQGQGEEADLQKAERSTAVSQA